MNKQLGTVILAAGKGKRMQLTEANKVTLFLADKPIIKHIVDFMHGLFIKVIIVVVGHHKESVIKSLQDESLIFVEQKEQLGTGDALKHAVAVLPKEITDILVVYGDDALLYSKDNERIIQKLIATQIKENNAITFLTIEQDNPQGLGRIIRDKNDKIIAIVEDKDATTREKEIKEINPGCFI
ncbi:MAG TPA: sugar phosphate nucleotidyltransferase, partial [Patescibacteria group bacterium]